jgi:hypothetical protein
MMISEVNMRKIRMSMYITPELGEKLEKQAKKLNISKSSIGLMAMQAGIRSIELASDPAWQSYFEKIIQEGKIELPWEILNK